MDTSIVLLTIVTTIGLYIFVIHRKKPRNYPPSPGWPLPVLGHMTKLGSRPYKTLVDWKSTYGPIVSLKFGSFPTVAISDYKLIKEALADSKFSGRPDLPTFKDRSGGTRHGILFSDGAEWVEIRRFTLRHLRDFGFGKKSMETILQDEAETLIERLKDAGQSPLIFRTYVNIAVLNSLWVIIASDRFEHDDPKMTFLLKLLSTNIAESNPLASLAFFVPWMGTWFPKLSGYNKFLKDIDLFLDILRVPLKAHSESLIPGQPRDLMDAFLEEAQQCTDPTSAFYGTVGQRVMITVFLDLFLAGAETTTTTLTHFALYMAAFPEIQEKLYAEIEKVIGRSRLPCLEDKASMPYTEAVMMEVHRISSMVPIGLFHSTLEDAELGGYHIPKDTMIISNLYSCHYDEQYWKDPGQFRPQRFLTPDGLTLVKHDAIMPFSTGKRVCLGENLARAELFLFSTSLCQRFKLTFDPDSTPASLEPNPGMLLFPPPHKIIFSEIL